MSGNPSSQEATSAVAPLRGARRLLTARRLTRWLLGLGIAYAVWFLLMAVGQDLVIYMGAYRSRAATDGPQDPAVQQLWLEPKAGVRVEGWFLPGDGRSPQNPGPAVLFLHGNKHRIDDIWRFSLPYVKAGYSFLAVDYRGYGRSSGEPSHDELISDSLAWFDQLAQRPEVQRDRIVLHGNSLGGAVAIAIAAQRDAAAVILESTFTSIADLFPRLGLPPFVCRAAYPSAELIARVYEPVLAVHGDKDWIIPMSHGQELARRAPRATFVQTDAGHMDYEPEWGAIWEFLGGVGMPVPATGP